ncbi:MAG: hypothetical protein KDA24_11300, partial [Deltaproteobacteria bacterium]|nr:hypothetical protein [Deltaproteobacteria bacterium]
MVLRIQCPNCGTAYRLAEPLPPEGKRYRCKCSAVITVAYPDSVRDQLAARGDVVPPSTQALKTGPVPHGAVPTGPTGLATDAPSHRRSPIPPPRSSGPVPPPPGAGPVETHPPDAREQAPTHRMAPSASLGGFAGFTAPPSMPPLS